MYQPNEHSLTQSLNWTSHKLFGAPLLGEGSGTHLVLDLGRQQPLFLIGWGGRGLSRLAPAAAQVKFISWRWRRLGPGLALLAAL